MSLKTESSSEILEGLLQDCGGLGKFQIVLLTVMLLSKATCAWSTLMMSVVGVQTDWWCEWVDNRRNMTVFLRNESLLQECSVQTSAGVAECSRHVFSTDLTTVVSEWDLVCDNDWVADFITTIQMAGLLVSGIFTGHLSDCIGRKPTYMLSIFLLVVLNILSTFSNTWEMFAAVRFLIGIAAGCMLTVYIILLIEYLPSRWRAAVAAIPSWSIELSIFGFVAMWLHDWKNLHYATAIVAFPFLFSWWIIPESFRWLVSRNRVRDAQNVIAKVAKWNGREVPDLSLVNKVAAKLRKENTKGYYTLKDLCNNQKLARITVLLSIAWVSCAYSYYAISFGVRSLSGDLYINIFLLNIVEVPAHVITWFLNNKIGRRWTSTSFFLLAGVAGLVTGALESTELEYKDDFINAFALICKLGVSSGWAAMQIFSSELYPTVVRNIGYGFLNTVARVGAIIAPQMVYLDESGLQGILYYACGGTMVISSVAVLFLPETNKQFLKDSITEDVIIIEDENLLPEDEKYHIYGTVSDKNKNYHTTSSVETQTL